MDLKVAIVITDELTDEVITSTGLLDLSSGEILRVRYPDDYDLDRLGPPWASEDYEFTSGMLSHEGKDVEFSVQVNRTTGQYAVSAGELLEIKLKAAALFAGMSGKDVLDRAESQGKGRGTPPAGKGRMH